MSKAKVASLTSAVISTKGAAAPSADTPIKALKNIENSDRTAVTVRLSAIEYRQLKLHGLENRQSNQEIIVAALNAYLSNGVNT
jgi:hypothetical protein